MSNNRNHLLLVFTVFSAAAISAATSSGNSTTPTAYEMLERFGFPRGVLPLGVQRYELRPTDGSFDVFLSGTGGCELRIPSGYMLRYDQHLSGTAQVGSLRALQGVSVKVWFAWIGITEVHRAGHQLKFLVGPIAASFPLGTFAYSPRCRGRTTVTAIAASS